MSDNYKITGMKAEEYRNFQFEKKYGVPYPGPMPVDQLEEYIHSNAKENSTHKAPNLDKTG